MVLRGLSQDPVLFAGGFESGDTGEWTAVQPQCHDTRLRGCEMTQHSPDDPVLDQGPIEADRSVNQNDQ